MILKSKTITFMLVMAALESIAAGLHMLSGILSADMFAVISFVLGIATSVGGVYLRTITNTALKDK